MRGEQVAIVRDVGFGNRDVGEPCLWFTVYLTESTAALQVFRMEQALEVVRASGARDVRDLEDRPCWVETDASTIRFLRWWEKR